MMKSYYVVIADLQEPIFFIGFIYSKDDEVVDIPLRFGSKSNDWWTGEICKRTPSLFNWKLGNSLRKFFMTEMVVNMKNVYVIPYDMFKRDEWNVLERYERLDKV